ncbi:MAG: HAD hydrolase-like protein [Candidatus Aegiribacteria sp.]|nr:HAD hydrolase-like protein [Candidatus Aegiribacteria sp.]
MIEAVIFDLDGTLLYTLEDICDVVNSVLKSNGMPGKSLDEVKHAIGRGIEELVRKVIPSEHVTDEYVGKLSDQIIKLYLEQGSVKTRPYPEITNLLERLQAERVPMAILTNKHQLSAERQVEKYFDGINIAVVSGARQGYPLKPSIEAVIPVLEKLGALPGNTLMVGDSDVDINTAVNAGMIAVGVSWGFRDVSLLLDHGAEFIVDSPMEIINLLGSGLIEA